MDQIRLGVIGCGGMMKSHVRGLSIIRDRCIVSAACDGIRAGEAVVQIPSSIK